MNILIVCAYGLYQDLSYSFVHAQAAAYAKLGNHVRVIVPLPFAKRDRQGKRVSAPLVVHRIDGVEIYDVRFPSLSNFGKRGWNLWAAKQMIAPQLSGILKDFSPNVIHAHTVGFGSELGKWLKGKLNVPLVVTTHGDDTSVPFEQGKQNFLYRCCDGIDTVAAVSSALAEKLRTCGTDTPVTTILNGFRVQHLPNVEGVRQPVSVIQVGQLSKQKRVETTIRAGAELRKAHPGINLTLIGSGSERDTLQALCREIEMTDAVDFAGQCTNEQVLAQMAQHRFFCMPSVREGFGIVYLEAMACGCVTIGTEGEGIADLIEHGKNGFLVPPDDPKAIASVVEWCIEHPEQTDAIAQQGKADALKLTWETNAHQYLELFTKLIE